MDKSYYIFATKNKNQVWAIPNGLMKILDLHEKESVELKFGSATTKVQVTSLVPDKQPGKLKMGLSPETLINLRIPEGTPLLIKAEGNKTFRLGPLIAILTFPGHIPGRLGYYKLFARRNSKKGLVYIFRGRGINPKTNTVNGYYYDPNEDKWKPGDLPYPDAVLDRCYPNPYICHVLLERVIGPNKIFNKKTMIDKIQFCKALDGDKLLRQHIPETKVFEKCADLKYFIRKYGEVFLKPTNGMKGHGIVVVKNAGRGMLECQYTANGENYIRNISNPSEIFSIMETAAGRKRTYIIQQSVSRMHYQGGPYSFRVWAMKNGQGRWVIPGMFAKGTFGNSFLTNFTAGAKLVALKDLFTDIIPRLPYTKDELVKLLESLTLSTAEALDKKYGPLGELGMDIVIDGNGKLWLIEANGNPGSIPIFIQTEYPIWRHLVFQYPMDYATFLAGF